MRYRLRTLLFVLAVLPPVLGWVFNTVSYPVVFVGFYGTIIGVLLLAHIWLGRRT